MASKKKEIVERVRVRMYRPFLGDCYLLTFFGSGGTERHLLIDCGILLGTAGGATMATEVVTDILNTTKSGARGRLHTVVATHEHWDHISGFAYAKKVFDKIDFDKVLLAWTEDENDPLAKDLRQRRAERLAALKEAVTKMKERDGVSSLALGIEHVLDFFGGLGADGGGPGGTKEAWEYIAERGAKSEQVYCPPGEVLAPFADLGGIRLYVLGPPQDVKLLKKSDASRRVRETYGVREVSLEDSFFSAVGAGDSFGGIEALCSPFESHQGISLETAKQMPFFKTRYGFASDHEAHWRSIDDDWLSTAGALALNLDGDTNNTCLALAIELVESGKVMLFPGDAQVGNWLSWQNVTWAVKDADGQERTVDSADLLKRTVLYKVGHHGSHNATLREHGLELMQSPELVAMIPVEREMAAKRKWNMPFPPLLERLNEKARGRVIRGDVSGPAEIEEACKGRLSQAAIERFLENLDLTTSARYIDYTISATG